MCISLNAQINKQFSWQGIARDNNGDLLDGTYNIEIKLFATETAPNPLWTETQTITINEGIINLKVGESSIINLDFESQYWMEITIGGGTPLQRIKLTPVPYAIISKTVEDNGITTEKIMIGGVEGSAPGFNADIALGSVGTNDIGAGQVHGNVPGFNGDITPNSVGIADINAAGVRGSVTGGVNAEIQANSVGTADVAVKQISGDGGAKDHIIDLSIDTPDLANNSVTSAKVGVKQISGDGGAKDHIVDNSIANDDIAAFAISGDAALGASGLDQIIDNSVGQDDLMPNSVSGSKALGPDNEDNIIDGSIQGSDIDDNQVVRSIGKAHNFTDHVDLVEGPNITIEDLVADNKIRISATCCQDFVTDIVFVTPENDTVVKITRDTVLIKKKIVIKGKSYHFDTEFYYKGIEHPITGGGRVIIDSIGIRVVDDQGDDIVRFDKDGSHHYKPEHYYDDVIIHHPDGSTTKIGDGKSEHTNSDGTETTTSTPGGTITERINENGTKDSTTTGPQGLEVDTVDDEGNVKKIAKIGKDDDGNGILEIYDKDGNLIFKVDKNGSVHNVKETYNKGIEIPNHNGKMVLDSNGISWLDSLDNPLYRLDSTGSHHNLPEEFTKGLKHPLTGGGYVQFDSTGFKVVDGDGNVKTKYDKTGSYHYTVEKFYEGSETVDQQTGFKTLITPEGLELESNDSQGNNSSGHIKSGEWSFNDPNNGNPLWKLTTSASLHFMLELFYQGLSVNQGRYHHEIDQNGHILKDSNTDTEIYKLEGTVDGAKSTIGTDSGFNPRTIRDNSGFESNSGESFFKLTSTGITGGFSTVDPAINIDGGGNINADGNANITGNFDNDGDANLADFADFNKTDKKVTLTGAAADDVVISLGTASTPFEGEAGAWNVFSDRRIKTNFSIIDQPIYKINQLNGYYFNWKSNPDGDRQVGVIAQEVQKVLPELVSETKDGYLSVSYSQLTALLIEAVKEQQEQIEELNNKVNDIENLQKENKVLKAKYDALEDLMIKINDKLNKDENIKKVKLTERD
jgi:hypothetical protein